MKWNLLIIVSLLPCTSQADLFKCAEGDGNIIYQSQPCKFFQRGEVLNIKENYGKGNGIRRSESKYLNERKLSQNRNKKSRATNNKPKSIDCERLKVQREHLDKRVRDFEKLPGVNSDSAIHNELRDVRAKYRQNCYG